MGCAFGIYCVVAFHLARVLVGTNLYVIAANVSGYLLEVARMQGKIRGVYVPGGNQLLNVYFANDGAVTSELTQNYPHAVSDTKR
jgi:hypothetical protein